MHRILIAVSSDDNQCTVNNLFDSEGIRLLP